MGRELAAIATLITGLVLVVGSIQEEDVYRLILGLAFFYGAVRIGSERR